MSSLNAAILPVTPLQQNCTLVWEEASKRAAVFDPGGDVDQILKAVDKLAIQVETIFLTHGHIDHAAGAAELKEKLDAVGPQPVPMVGPDRRDQFLLDGLETQAAMFGMAGARNVTPDRWLDEGDQVEIGAESFHILHCPGHSPGSVVFVNHANKLIIMGDVLFRGSIGRTDFPYGDHDALITAIRTKLFPLGDDFQFTCGHGPGSTLGEERKSNPFVGEAA
ncbi:MAG: MBL fold metallo-hydrolase [Geminicoccaceae bacterium]